ncbi:MULTISPECIES: pilus assembly protein [unclassified Corallococcus]|uniref:pilus assembly protein n=1 Tax=unclassified Corallococcus TaxID=2685029 RepID=UPI001A8E81BE|nr:MULTISPECIES: pilus assembly protein [unclassified Corallococcus]MBN9681882.1 pilus assembly protein [Corallococcus sp. NCSPR001]WAS86551.1 pilus assembly protein [Corallococcus sp. NCRR]
MHRHLRRHRRQARGQSIVEAALGVTLFVTILVFGIHFAEVGFLSLKVQEAAVSALWNGTHGEMHDIPLDYGSAHDSMRQAGEDAQARYADFNGLSSVNRGDTITQVFTRGSDLRVNCRRNGGLDWDGPVLTRLMYRDEGGTACTSQANLSSWNIPTRFLDQNSETGLYKEQHQDPTHANIQVCGIGRAVGGTCRGSFSMLVDDWGLSNEIESSKCVLFQDMALPCTNGPFYAATKGVYEPTTLPIPTYASFLAMDALFMNPLPPLVLMQRENTFWMSAAGEESQFMQAFISRPTPLGNLWNTSPGALIGITTPHYGLGYLDRNGCFLGKDC